MSTVVSPCHTDPTYQDPLPTLAPTPASALAPGLLFILHFLERGQKR